MMGVDSVNESWFSSLWRIPRGRVILRSEKAMIGILAFEITSLMSKVVNMWNCLSDRQISSLKEDLFSSFGVIKLVSDDENQLMEFAFAEIFENLGYVAQSVILLAKRCSDTTYLRLEQFFNNPDESNIDWCGWAYTRKKMEKKVKKMSTFVAFTSQLYHEMEVLVELEQTLRRMQLSSDTDRVKLLEFQQKVTWQRQEVKNLRDMSPWSRNYDYIVRLLAKSLFTIIERIKVIFEINNQHLFAGERAVSELHSDQTLPRSVSLVQSQARFVEKNQASIFYSGPMSMSSSRLGLGSLSSRARKRQQKQLQSHHRHASEIPKVNRFGQSGPFKGCLLSGGDLPSTRNPSTLSKKAGAIFGPRQSILSRQFMSSITPPGTLGASALTRHYANLIILIEKLAPLPHLVGSEARDDLYSMLPSNIKTALRARLKQYGRKPACPSTCDVTLASEWNMAMTRILDWLSPLAHNTVRRQSERNFEKQNAMVRPSVRLVQTLYFADQVKTEEVVLELLMGLNYLCRCSKEVYEKAVLGCAESRDQVNFPIQCDATACSV